MNKLNVIRIANPLNPTEHTREVVKFKHGQSIADMFPDVMGAALPWGITHNGRVVDPEDRSATYPQDGDFVTVCPMPTGGGGSGKQILRLVALIAVAVYAPYAAEFLTAGEGLFFSGGALAGWSTAGVTAGLTIAGSLLVNSLFSPVRRDRQSSAESSTYGIDGAKNTSAEGLVVPICYGKFRMGGNILSNYVVNDGNTQILYMLLNAGEGPVASIDSVQINEQPIANFKDWEFVPQLGNLDQDPNPWFAASTVPMNVGQEFTADWKTVTVGNPGTDVFDRMRIDIVAPYGLMEVVDGGKKIDSVTVNIEFEYRPAGSAGAWIPLALTNQVTGYTEQPEYVEGFNPVGETILREEDRLYIVTYDGTGESLTAKNVVVGQMVQVPTHGLTGGPIPITANQRSAYRRSFMTVPLAQGAYELRYRRGDAPTTETDTKADKVFLSDVNKIVDEQVGYRLTATAALKIRLSDQLNGLPQVTYINGGKVIKVWDADAKQWIYEASSNPAWIVWDILTNKRYGGGCPESRIDFHRWVEWATWCYQEGLEFHGVIDTQTNVWDAASQVARCGRAQILPVGTRYSVVIERQDDPVQMFSVANMISGTFKESWSGMSDRANEIEVAFQDREDNYKQRTIRLYDTDALLAGQPQRVARVEMRGIVTAERAYKEAELLLNMNRWIQRTVEFGAPLDAIVSRPGDIINVQHDMPQWGFGGRLETGSTTTLLKLDRPVLMEGGKTYQALVHSDSILRLNTTVLSVVGDAVFLNGYTGATNVKRLHVSGKDLEVFDIVQSGVNWGVRVPSTIGVSTGAAAQLFDTNALTTRNVVNPLAGGQAVEVTEVTLASPLASAPAQFDKWLYGETNKVTKPFRITKIYGSHEYRRDIVAIEYYPQVYEGLVSGEPPNYSALNPRVVQHVIIDGVGEVPIMIDTVAKAQVTVGFHSNQQTYRDAEVYVSRNGGIYTIEGTGRDSFTVDAQRGDVLSFKIVAFDTNGRNSGFASAPSISYTVTGNTALPPDVTGFTVDPISVGLEVKWDHWDASNAGETEIRNGADWATGTTLWRGRADRVTAADPPPGTYNLWIKHFDITGFLESANATNLEVNWDGTTLVGVLTVSADSQIFKIDTAGAPTPTSITITANGHGLPGSPTFTVVDGTAVLSGTGATRTLAYVNMSTDMVTVEVVWGTQTERISFFKLRDGGDAYQAALSNETRNIPCDANGNPISGTPITSQMFVARGATVLNSGVVYSCISSTGFTGTPSTYINATTGAISIPSISADFASATFQAAVTGGPTLQKTLTAAKAKQGAVGKMLSISATSQAMTFDGAGVTPKPASQTITLTAVKTGTFSGATAWSATAYNASNSAIGTVTMGGSGDTRAITETQYMANGASTAYVYVTAVADGITDQITIVKLNEGAASVTGYLTNESVTLNADANGNITGNIVTLTTGTFKVFQGTTDRTSSASFGAPTASGCTVNGPAPGSGVYSISSMSADSATVDFTATYAGVTITKRMSLAKSKTGQAGTGQTGQSNHRVYIARPIGSPPATPGNTVNGATPAGWSATPVSLSAGQEQYQSDGTTPAGNTTTTWATPYPSYLKVGDLSAISANLGTITAGNITSTANIDITGYGRFKGTDTTTVYYFGSSVSKSAALSANTSNNAQVGLYGQTNGTSGFGVVGVNRAGYSGGSYGVGVYGEGGIGVQGYALNSSSIGVFGTMSSSISIGKAGYFGVNGNSNSGAIGVEIDASNQNQKALTTQGGKIEFNGDNSNLEVRYKTATRGGSGNYAIVQSMSTSTFSLGPTSSGSASSGGQASTSLSINLSTGAVKVRKLDITGATVSTSTAGGAVTYLTNLPSGTAAATAKWVEVYIDGVKHWMVAIPA